MAGAAKIRKATLDDVPEAGESSGIRTRNHAHDAPTDGSYPSAPSAASSDDSMLDGSAGEPIDATALKTPFAAFADDPTLDEPFAALDVTASPAGDVRRAFPRAVRKLLPSELRRSLPADSSRSPGELDTDRPPPQSSPHTGLSYRNLDYPWPAGHSPFTAEVEAATRDWVTSSRLVGIDQLTTRYDRVNVGKLACLAFPSAPLDRLITISQFLAWIFIQDDRFDDAISSLDQRQLHKLLETYREVLVHGTVLDGAPPVATALCEIARRISWGMSPTWMSRFSASMSGFWLKGIAEETRYRAEGIVPDPAAYMRMRVHSIGVLPFLDLVEMARGFELPPALARDQTLNRLRILAARVISYANDVFSFEKETRAGDALNFISVLMHHTGASFAEAVEQTIRTHDREVAVFIDLESRLPDPGPHARGILQAYVDGLRSWIRGALDWQLKSRRYDTGREYLDTNVL